MEIQSLRDPNTGQWLYQDKVPQVKRFEEFVTIDWVEDELDNHANTLVKYRTTGKSLRLKIVSFTQNWLVLGSMGVIIGLIAGCLNIITAWLSSIKLGHCSNGFYLTKSFCCWGKSHDECSNWNSWTDYSFFNYIGYIMISVLLGSTAAFLVKNFAPSAAGSGISEIKCIVSGFVIKGFLGWWTLLIKSLGLPLAIGSGLSVGKEGPSVHYAVAVGNSIAKLFSKYRRSALRAREFLTATAAAGVAVAFGSPMGGVLFSMEEISSVFQLSTIWKSYFCSLVAVSTLATLNPFRTGQLVLFEVAYDTNWHYFEIPIYIILGAFGGIYGIIVSKLNIRVVAFRKKYFTNYAIREVVLLTTLTAIICYFNEFLRLDMTESMEILFHECDTSFEHPICSPDSSKIRLVVSLIYATIMRMALTIITYGCKVPAGIFVPSMAAGATFGRALGVIIDVFYKNHSDSSLFSTCTETKCIIPGTYAFLGAAAALSGITHLTVTVVVIMFELTGALRFIIPTMIVISVTKIINDRWGNGGIADQMIKFNGLPLLDPKEEFIFNTTVEAAMTKATVAIPNISDIPLKLNKLKTLIQDTDFRGFPIIESELEPKITGYVNRSDLEFIMDKYNGYDDSSVCNFNDRSTSIDDIDFTTIINPCPLTVQVQTTLEYVLDLFIKLGPRYILIEENGFLVGLITRKDILRYEHTMHSLCNHDDSQEEIDRVDEQIWDIMNLMARNLRKNMGKLFHNDVNRYL